MAAPKPLAKRQPVKKVNRPVAKSKSNEGVIPTQKKPWYRRALAAIAKRQRDFLARRPHRSFRLTRRRDYNRTLKLPGLITFSYQVHKILWKNRKIFTVIVILYALFIALFIGLTSQDSYSQITSAVTQATTQVTTGNLGSIGNAFVVLLSVLSGTGSSSSADPSQQVGEVVIGLFVWLTTVWLLRNILAGHKVKARDGIYNAGAPIISTFIVFAVLVAQLLPIAIAAFCFVAATNTGLLDQGVQAMLFWVAASLLIVLSFYWITATFMGLIVVTLPGMYPFRALRIAGDIVVGRRLRILGRILWLLLVVLVAWPTIFVPIILFDSWLKGFWPAISWLPIVPVALVIMSSLTIVWIGTYVYLLYRKVVDDDALPA